MQLRVTAVLHAEAEPGQIGYAIFRHILEIYHEGEFDDAGCDWYTDDDGNTCIAADPEWRPFRQDKEITALVDAANILVLGHALKMPKPEENTYENEEAAEHYYGRLTTEHAASSYGQPVFVDSGGQAYDWISIAELSIAELSTAAEMGSKTSARKAARANGRKGGRPRK
jgi:hypothetical protein